MNSLSMKESPYFHISNFFLKLYGNGLWLNITSFFNAGRFYPLLVHIKFIHFYDYISDLITLKYKKALHDIFKNCNFSYLQIERF